MKKIAVYGSLRKGLHNHKLIEDSKYLGQMESEHIFNLYSLGSFPGLRKGGSTSVIMEVYEVTDEVFERVDQLEGYREEDKEGSFYLREKMFTPYGEVYYYLYNDEPGTDIVESGDWTEYRKLQSIIA